LESEALALNKTRLKPNANEIRAFYGTVALASYLFGGAKAPLPSLV